MCVCVCVCVCVYYYYIIIFVRSIAHWPRGSVVHRIVWPLPTQTFCRCLNLAGPQGSRLQSSWGCQCKLSYQKVNEYQLDSSIVCMGPENINVCWIKEEHLQTSKSFSEKSCLCLCSESYLLVFNAQPTGTVLAWRKILGTIDNARPVCLSLVRRALRTKWSLVSLGWHPLLTPLPPPTLLSPFTVTRERGGGGGAVGEGGVIEVAFELKGT